ncbi:hypothetical protein LM602_08700 [Candidatus Acetothermia bacterium]|jgi:hypothetical protein|nr:hypothetical protein [Candidatus Acetothermia bacterium]MCI2432603.1 hypothetical protein [Candidatus Acetothermia bacterium]MCI2436640.1 hypothetical protein [Candidatus Acetothermia bacterium]
MTNYQIPMRVGLAALILAALALALSFVYAIQQDVWGKAWLQVINLGLVSVAVLLVTAVIWRQYVKQQTVGMMAFLTLAIISIMALGWAWNLLGQLIHCSLRS